MMVVDKIIQHIASEQKGWERHHGRAEAGPYPQAINRLQVGASLLDYFGKDDYRIRFALLTPFAPKPKARLFCYIPSLPGRVRARFTCASQNIPPVVHHLHLLHRTGEIRP